VAYVEISSRYLRSDLRWMREYPLNDVSSVARAITTWSNGSPWLASSSGIHFTDYVNLYDHAVRGVVSDNPLLVLTVGLGAVSVANVGWITLATVLLATVGGARATRRRSFDRVVAWWFATVLASSLVLGTLCESGRTTAFVSNSAWCPSSPRRPLAIDCGRGAAVIKRALPRCHGTGTVEDYQSFRSRVSRRRRRLSHERRRNTMNALTERAVLAGGRFWAMQDLIRRRAGVLSTRVGYSGGDVENATYRNHGTHAEAIEIIFDPSVDELPRDFSSSSSRFMTRPR
jgi:hypothetical protein